MKKTIYSMSCVLFSAFLLSCTPDMEIKQTNDTSKKTTSDIATDYVKNLYIRNNVATGRSIYSEEYPSFLYEEDIEDTNGNKILFSEMTDEEKKVFFEIWEKTYISELAEKFKETPELAEMVAIENNALDLVVQELNRSCENGIIDPNDLGRKYIKILKKQTEKMNKQKARSSSSGGDSVTADCLVESSVNKLKANYKKGRVLVSTGTGSSGSSGFAYLGHASMMYFDEWGEDWNKNGLANAMITSSPKNTGSSWPGKVDGVQLEPIGYWAGNSSGSATKVMIHNVGKSKWVWNWLKSGNKFTDAPTSDYVKAVEKADKYKGCKYNWNYANKWDMEEFYCSQLVWRAWERVSEDYNLSSDALIWVAPSDLANSKRSKEIATYKNK